MEGPEIQYEEELLRLLQKRDIETFRQIYKEYSEDMLLYAFSLLSDTQKATDKVIKLFEMLWSEVDFTQVSPPLYSHLCELMRVLCEKK